MRWWPGLFRTCSFRTRKREKEETEEKWRHVDRPILDVTKVSGLSPHQYFSLFVFSAGSSKIDDAHLAVEGVYEFTFYLKQFCVFKNVLMCVCS